MPSQSLTDEILELAEDYAHECEEYAKGNVSAPVTAYAALESRLQEIETELTELRKLHASELAFDKLLASDKSIAFLDKERPRILAGRAAAPDPRPTMQLGEDESLLSEKHIEISDKTCVQTSALPCSSPIEELGEDDGN